MPDKEHILRLYGQYCRKVAELLKEGMALPREERSFIENHIVLVQLALATKKYSEPQNQK